MGAIGTIGQTVTPTGGSSVNYTWIDKRNPATAKGIVKAVTIQCYAGGVNTPNNVAIKIFRVNGSNYEVIYNQIVTTMVEGTNVITLATPQNILIGDLIGYYSGLSGSVAVLSYQAGTGTGHHNKVGNVTTATAIADWGSGTETLGMYAQIMATFKGGFSGFSPWIFLKDMWERHDRLWTPDKKLILPEDLGFSY